MTTPKPDTQSDTEKIVRALEDIGDQLYGIKEELDTLTTMLSEVMGKVGAEHKAIRTLPYTD